MNQNGEYKGRFCLETKNYEYENSTTLVKKVTEEKKGKKRGKTNSRHSRHWSYVFVRLFMVIYICAIFIGIFRDNQELIMMGSVFAFFYTLLTSAYFKRFSKEFYSLTGASLSCKWFIGLLSFGLGVMAFFLENETHIFTKYLPFSISILNNLLMGISLVIIFYDSRQAMQGLPGTKSEEIERIEVNKSFQKNPSEDVNVNKKIEES